MGADLKFVLEKQDYGMPMVNVADVSIDSNGNIFAIVRAEIPILVFNKDGRYLYGFGKGMFRGPHGVYIDKDDNVYGVDSSDHIVMKFTPQGDLLMTIGTKGVHSDSGCLNGNFKTVKYGGGPFYSPTKVTTSQSGEIFVTDGYGNARVHRFAPDGTLIKSWGEPGSGPGQFHLPHGIVVDKQNQVFVADRENDRIQIFDVEGKLLDIWENISRPTGIVVTDEYVYVAELGHRMYVDNVFFEPDSNSQWSQVRIFDLKGKEVAKFGGPEGWKAGNLFAAHSIALDNEGSIYIGEVIWPISESTPPADLHPALQKFRRV